MVNNIFLNINKNSKINIPLTVERVEACIWNDLGFDKEHYMTDTLNPSCKCFLFRWNNIPVGFVGLINSPNKDLRFGFRISRIVVLPHYQGLGLSSKIMNFIGGIVKAYNDEAQLYIKTINTKMGSFLEKSNDWEATSYNGKKRKKLDFEMGRYNNRLERASYCFKFIGKPIYGYEELMKPIGELRNKKHKQLEIEF